MRVPSLQMSTARCCTPSGNPGRRCAPVADDKSSTTAISKTTTARMVRIESLPGGPNDFHKHAKMAPRSRADLVGRVPCAGICLSCRCSMRHRGSGLRMIPGGATLMCVASLRGRPLPCHQWHQSHNGACTRRTLERDRTCIAPTSSCSPSKKRRAAIRDPAGSDNGKARKVSSTPDRNGISSAMLGIRCYFGTTRYQTGS